MVFHPAAYLGCGHGWPEAERVLLEEFKLTYPSPRCEAASSWPQSGELCTDIHGRGLWDASDAELLEAVWQFHRGYETETVPLSRPKPEPTTAAGEPAQHGALPAE